MSKKWDAPSRVILILVIAVALALVLDVLMTHKILLDTTVILHKQDVEFGQRIKALERR